MNPNVEEVPVDNEDTTEMLSYIPQVRDALIPKVGQTFRSLEDAIHFYNCYARDGGFGTRIKDNKRIDGVITWRKFVCCKEELKKDVTIPNRQRRRGLIREDCGARMVVSLSREEELYVVTKFDDAHNHSLTTLSKVHLLRSHRKITKVKKSLVDQLQISNIPTCQQMSVLQVDAGGSKNVGFIPRDLYNARRDDRIAVDGQDAQMVKEYFEKQVRKNPEFRFSVKKDEDGRLVHCFWATAGWRQAYEYFGDVVVFDTTFNTNRYKLIFAPIVGVNHHRQTTFFGCAFLSDEKAESFEWLFREWLGAMPAGPPKMIITDQDAAMTKAIVTVLPNTCHRYCSWHILKKFPEKLGPMKFNESNASLKNCIWNSESPVEFEDTWFTVLEEHDLEENELLNSLYEIRAQWVPAYTKQFFSAGMTSSQRAESTHSFLKRFVNSKNSLWDFITRFKRGLENMKDNELMLDQVDLYETPMLRTSCIIEETMRGLYTRVIFFKFQDEVFESLRYMVEAKDENVSTFYYTVQHGNQSHGRVREVMVDKLTQKISCTCLKFESEGIPYRHVLTYLYRANIFELPEQFKLHRWMQSGKMGRIRHDLDGCIVVGSSLLTKRHCLIQSASRLIDEALMNESNTKILEEGFDSIRQQFVLTRTAAEVQSVSPTFRTSELLKEPPKPKEKGPAKRYKSALEKSQKKQRKCKGCASSDQDRRKCPKLINTSSTSLQWEFEDDYPSFSLGL